MKCKHQLAPMVKVADPPNPKEKALNSDPSKNPFHQFIVTFKNNPKNKIKHVF